jgi:hypothetical protein
MFNNEMLGLQIFLLDGTQQTLARTTRTWHKKGRVGFTVRARPDPQPAKSRGGCEEDDGQKSKWGFVTP